MALAPEGRRLACPKGAATPDAPDHVGELPPALAERIIGGAGGGATAGGDGGEEIWPCEEVANFSPRMRAVVAVEKLMPLALATA